METLLDTEQLEELKRRVEVRLKSVEPEPLKMARGELTNTLQLVLDNALQYLDIITREEFAVQAELLKRTRITLATLQARLDEIERETYEKQSD